MSVSVHTEKTHPHAAMYICDIYATEVLYAPLQSGNSDITATVLHNGHRVGGSVADRPHPERGAVVYVC